MGKTNKLYGVTKKLQAKKPSKRRKKTVKRRLSPWIVATALSAVLLAVMLPYIRSGRLAETGAPVPKGYHSYCIDLSHHNGTAIAWDSLRVVIDARGRTSKDLLGAREILPVSRIYLKATEGTSFRDRRFAQNWEAAGQIRAQRGAYHFFRSSADPKKQAENFIAAVGPLRHGDLSPVLDIETMHRGCTKDTLNQRALTWLKAVEKHYGRRPVIYTSDRFALDILSSDITEHYPLWIARYGGKTPDSPACTMWQFTDRAVIHGIRGYVDLSVVTAP